MDVKGRRVPSVMADRGHVTSAVRVAAVSGTLAALLIALLPLGGAAPALAQEQPQQVGASVVEEPEDAAEGVRLAWKRRIASRGPFGSGADYAYGVATDGEGNVVVAGLTDTSGGGPSEDGPVWAWVRKYDLAGKRLWERQLDTPGLHDSSRGVAVDRSGNALITGNTCRRFGPCLHAYLAKFSGDGQLLWKRKRVAPAGTHIVSWGVAVDHNRNVFISGSTTGTLRGQNRGGYDAWVAKYTKDGELLWTRQLGTVDDDLSRAVTVDGGGNAIIAGYVANPSLGSGGPVYNAWIAKYNPDGRLMWKRRFGARDSGSRAEGVAPDGSGNVVITGLNNVSRVWLAKYDAAGNILWELENPYSGNYSANVAATTEGEVAVSGTAYVNSDNNQDAWVAKYDSDGQVVWRRLIANDTDNNSDAVAVDGSGNVVVAGWDGIPGDAWVAKFHED